MTYSPGSILVFAALVVYLGCLILQLRYRRLKQHASWPQLPPSLVWGHMKALHLAIESGPTDRHIDVVFGDIRKQLGSPPVMFLDLRPASYPTLVVCDHNVAEQVSRGSKSFRWSVPKSPGMKSFIRLIGPHSILTAEGEKWKSLRRRFNPGFAPKRLMTLLPCIVDKTQQFLHHLDSYARTGEEFLLEELCTNLTFDIIGAVIMDFEIGAQLDRARQSEFIQLYRALAEYSNEDHGRTWPWQWVAAAAEKWRLARRLDALLGDLVRKKFADLQQRAGPKDSRSILALSLQDLHVLTPLDLAQIRDQLKTFLFAGHDTTSILLQWALYELARTPRALAAVRAELDETIGPDQDPASVREKLLSQGEEIFGRMTYTGAVIKEVLRLYPPAGTARMAPPGSGATVYVPEIGEQCIDGLAVYNCATIIQRDEKVYGETANDFVPERWLGSRDDEARAEAAGAEEKEGRIPVGAWRPFERGPRDCIGQELANIEARVILACVVRRYDFCKVGLGEVARDSQGQLVLNSKGQFQTKSHLYNTRQVTAKPVDGTRMRVKLTPRAPTGFP